MAHAGIGFHADQHAGLFNHHHRHPLDGFGLSGEHLGLVSVEEQLVIGGGSQDVPQDGLDSQFGDMPVVDVKQTTEAVQRGLVEAVASRNGIAHSRR